MLEISKKNAEILGKQILLFQTQEDCGDLIQAIGKYNRVNGIGQKTDITEKQAYEELKQKIADVTICIEQLTYLLGCEAEVKELKNIAFKRTQKVYGIEESISWELSEKYRKIKNIGLLETKEINIIRNTIDELLKKYDKDVIDYALNKLKNKDESARRNKNYLYAILKDWDEKGWNTIQKVKDGEKQYFNNKKV